MSMFIRGMGLAVPPHTMTQQQAIELARGVNCQTEQQERMLSVLYRKSGVQNRHTSLPYETGFEWLRAGATRQHDCSLANLWADHGGADADVRRIGP